MASFLTHESEYRGSQAVLNREKVRLVLCGVGALGSKALNLLVSQGYSNILIIDKDRVEHANFGTQDYGLPDVGRMKAAQAKIGIFKRFKVQVDSFEGELTASNAKKYLSGADLVIDMFDNSASRNMVRDFCKTAQIEVLHAGMSDDGFAEIEWNERYLAHPTPIEAGEAPCDYPLAANLVAMTVALLVEVVNRFVDKKVKQSIHFTLKDLHIDKVHKETLR